MTRTDAAEVIFAANWRNSYGNSISAVYADFARTLETELTQAQAELKELGERFDGLAKAHEAMIPHQVELRHERDAAVAELADVKPDRDRWEKLARQAAEARLAAQAEAAAMRAERDEARRALQLECQDWADDDTRVKAIAAEFGIKDCHENHDAFKGVIEIAEEMAVKIREAEAEREELRGKLNRECSNHDVTRDVLIEADGREIRLIAERDAANALVDRLAGVLDQFSKCELSEENCASFDVANRRIRNIARKALAEVAKSLSPRTTENTKPQ